MVEFSPIILALVPVVIGLTSLAKMYMPSKYAPIVSLALGVAGAFLFPASTIAVTILSGVVVGLTASGLYSGTKATIS